MSDIVSSLSSQTGIGADQIRKGLGAVLKMLQDQLPPELFSKVQGVLPDAGEMISASEPAGKEAGGIWEQGVEALRDVFRSTTIADIARREAEEAGAGMYHI